MNKAYIALGTNIEPRFDFLNRAIGLLAAHPDISILQKSSIYETEPVGYLEQANFLNMVLEVNTTLASLELLDVCQGIENELGRKRNIRFGPRTIDLDILLFNNENRTTEQLMIPHPRMHERAFVLTPLADVAPNKIIPTRNESVVNLLEKLPEKEKDGVIKWMQSELEEE